MAKEEIVLKGYSEQTKNFQKLADSLAQSNIEARSTAAMQLKTDKEQLEKFAELLKETGIEAKDNQKYRDEEVRIKKAELALRKQGATSRAAREEIAKEENELQSNRFEKFFGQNSFVGKSLGGLGDKIGNLIPGGGVKGILGTLGTVAVLGGLVTFLQSETWKDLKEKIIPALARGLETFNRVFTEFVNDLVALFVDPSLENLIELFTGDSSLFILGLVAVTALLNPFKSLKVLRLAVNGLIKGVGAFSRGLNMASSQLGGGPIDKQGRKLTKNKAGRLVVGPGQKGAGTFAKVAKGAKVLKAAKFIPGVGVAVTALFGLFDGVTAGLEEAKKEGATKLSIMREGVAGTLSGLTFGLVSQEGISGAMTKVSEGFTNALNKSSESVSKLWTSTTESFSNFKTAVQTELTSENITKKMDGAISSINSSITKVSDKFTELTGFELPDIKIPTTAEMKTKFENFVTNIKELKMPTLDEVKTGFANLSEKVKNFKVPNVGDIANAYVTMGDKLSAGAEKLTGLKLPDFTDVKNLIEEKFSFKFSDLKLPEIPDFGELFMDVIRRILAPIINFTMPGLFGFGDSQPLRFALGKMGSVGKELLNFVDKAGSVTPSTTPSRPAASVTPTTAGEAGRGGSPIIINQSTQSNTRQGDQFSLSKGITDNSFGAQIANTFAQ